MAFITTNPSPFLVNVPELQNVITDATGVSAVQSLSNTVNSLLTYIDTANSQVNINTIGAEGTGNITVTNNLNLSNAQILFLGSPLLGSNSINGVAGYLAFQVVGVEYGRFTTAGLNVTGNLVATGDLYANGNLYPSDRSLKSNIAPYAAPRLPTPVSFQWRSSGERDIGVIADEVAAIEPACVKRGPSGTLHVDYAKLTVLLLAEVADLRREIQELKGERG